MRVFVIFKNENFIEVSNAVSCEYIEHVQAIEIIRLLENHEKSIQYYFRESLRGYEIINPNNTEIHSHIDEKIVAQFVSPDKNIPCNAVHPQAKSVCCALQAGHDGEHQSFVPSWRWE